MANQKLKTHKAALRIGTVVKSRSTGGHSMTVVGVDSEQKAVRCSYTDADGKPQEVMLNASDVQIVIPFIA